MREKGLENAVKQIKVYKREVLSLRAKLGAECGDEK